MQGRIRRLLDRLDEPPHPVRSEALAALTVSERRVAGSPRTDSPTGRSPEQLWSRSRRWSGTSRTSTASSDQVARRPRRHARRRRLTTPALLDARPWRLRSAAPRSGWAVATPTSPVGRRPPWSCSSTSPSSSPSGRRPTSWRTSWPRITSATGLIGFLFATFAVSWAWINFTWFASAYDTDDWIYRLDHDGADGGRAGAGPGVARHVRVTRRARPRRQRCHGARLRRHAGPDGGAVGASQPAGPGPRGHLSGPHRHHPGDAGRVLAAAWAHTMRRAPWLYGIGYGLLVRCRPLARVCKAAHRRPARSLARGDGGRPSPRPGRLDLPDDLRRARLAASTERAPRADGRGRHRRRRAPVLGVGGRGRDLDAAARLRGAGSGGRAAGRRAGGAAPGRPPVPGRRPGRGPGRVRPAGCRAAGAGHRGIARARRPGGRGGRGPRGGRRRARRRAVRARRATSCAAGPPRPAEHAAWSPWGGPTGCLRWSPRPTSCSPPRAG